MKNVLKRLGSLALAILMVVSLLPLQIFAAEEEVTYVAKIGTTQYTTLEAAATAAKNQNTVTLLSDCTAGTIAFKQNCTLNLNGFALEVDTITVASGKSVNIKGGTLTGEPMISGNIKLTSVTATNLVVDAGTTTLVAGSAITDVKVQNNGVLAGEFTTVSGTISASAHVLNYGATKVTGYYGSLNKAITATTYKGYTVVLDADAKLNEPIQTEANIKLDLKGHNITVADGCNTAIINTTGLTIQDSTADATVPQGQITAAVAVENHAGLTVTGGAVINGAIQNLDAGTVTLGTCTINGAVDAGAVLMNANGVIQKYYADLQAAINAAGSGYSVVLLSNTVLTDTLAVATGKKLTLDLNGYTISQVKEQTEAYSMITNEGTLTIQDSVGGGKISYTDSGKGGEYVSNTITNSGTLTVKGGIIENASAAEVGKNGYPYAIDNHSTTSNATLTIQDGTLISNAYCTVRQYCNSATYTNKLTINGGTLEGGIEFQNPNANANKGTLKITGGTIKGGSVAALFVFGGSDWSNMTASITGGQFEGNVTVKPGANLTGFISGGVYDTDVTAHCAEGLVSVDDGNGNYVVKVNTGVAQIGDTKYQTLEAALNAVRANETIILLEDIVIDIDGEWDSRDYAVNYPITLDGNGKSVTYIGSVVDRNGNYVLRLNENSTVKNLTLDLSQTTSMLSGIAAKNGITVEDSTLIGNGQPKTRAIQYGASASSDIVANIEATVTDCSFKNWAFGVSDNQNGVDAKKITVTGSTFDNASALISAYESITFTGNTIADGSWCRIESYTGKKSGAPTLKVVATGNTMNRNESSWITNVVTYHNIQWDFYTFAPVAVSDATGNGFYHDTLACALTEAQEGQTIEVLLATSLAENVTNAKVLTIDLNGNTVADSDCRISNQNQLTIVGEGEIATEISLIDVDATVVAKEGLNVTSGVEGYVVVYENGVYRLAGAVATVTDAQGNVEYFTTLQGAIDAAEDGELVTLLKDVSESAIITIDKAITLDGDGHTLTSTATRAVNVATEGKVTIKDLTIVGSNNTQRAINVIQKAANLTLENVTAEDFTYTVNVAASSVGSEITINGGKFSGYAALNVTGDNTTVTVNNAELIGNNNAPAHESNNFGVIAIGEKGVKNVNVTVTDSTLTATSTNGNRQFIVAASDAVDTVFNIDGTLNTVGNDVFNGNPATVTATFPKTYEDKIRVQGYAYVDNGDETVTIVVGVVAVIATDGTETIYATLEEALKIVRADETVKLLQDITIYGPWDSRKTAVNYPITLDGNGKTLTFIGDVKDLNGGYVLRLNEDSTVKNLTLDLSQTTGMLSGIAAKKSITIENSTLIGNGVATTRGVQYGASAGANIADVEVTVVNSTFKNWDMGVSDNQSGNDCKSVTITDCTFDNASAMLSARETLTFTGNTIAAGSYCRIESYTGKKTGTPTLNVNATGNTMEHYERSKVTNAVTYHTVQWEFITSAPAAEMDENGYGYYHDTLACALKETQEGRTIRVLLATSLAENVTNAKVLTIDLNGNTVADSDYRISNQTQLTIVGEGEIATEISLIDVDATVVAKEGLNVTSGVEGYVVVYENGVYRLAGAVATVTDAQGNVEYFTTLQGAIDAAEDGELVTLLKDVSETAIITIDKPITLDGNGKTLTSTATRAVNVATEGDVEIKNLTIVGSNNTQRAINVIQKAANLTLENVTAEDFTYTVNVAASSVGSEITINGGKYSGYAALNVTGDNTTVTVNNAVLIGNNNAPAHESNNFGVISIGDSTSGETADNVKITVNGGTLTATSANGNDQFIVTSTAVTNATVVIDAELSLSNGLVFNGDPADYELAAFRNAYGDELSAQGYAHEYHTETLIRIAEAVAYNVQTGMYYADLQKAFAEAEDGQTIRMLKDIELDKTITNTKQVTLDLNGKTITGTDNNTSGNFYLFNNNKGDLTIDDSVGTGKITLTATNERNWSASSVVVANNQGNVTVNGGTIEHLGGTAMAYGIDNLTNGSIGDATTTVNGGKVDSTYFAIRQFANSASKMNTVVINDGQVGYVWMQSPNSNENLATTIVEGGEVTGICLSGVNAEVTLKALETSTEIVYGTPPVGEVVVLEDGYYILAEAEASVTDAEGNVEYFAKLEDAIKAAEEGELVTLLKNVEKSQIITIDKSITLDGGDHTLTSTAGRAINVDCAGEVTIQNLEILGDEICQRGVNIINQAGTINLENVTVSGVTHYAVHVATSAGAAEVNIKDSDLTGYAAIATYGDGATIQVENSDLTGINNYNGESNSFSTIALGGKDVTITVTGGTVTAVANSDQAQYILGAQKDACEDCTVLIDAELNYENGTGIVGLQIDDTTVIVRDDYGQRVNEEGYLYEDYTEELIVLTGTAVAYNVQTNVYYGDLQVAIVDAEAGQTVRPLVDISAAVITVYEGVTLDLDGFDLTTKYFTVYGDVIDGEAGGVGMVKADRAHVGGAKSYLSLYDTEVGAYRFYKYELENRGGKASGADAVKFGITLRFTNADGYRVLATSTDTKLTLSALVTWTGLDGGVVEYEFYDTTLRTFGQTAARQAQAGKVTAAITLTLKGISSLPIHPTDLTMRPQIRTETDMHIVGESTVYTVN